MTPSRIMRTLDFGAMMTIAYTLNRDEREAVAEFLGKPGAGAGAAAGAFCAIARSDSTRAPTPVWNGWSPSPDNSRFAPAALAKLTADQVPRLKLKWAFGFEGDISAFAQPTVIGDQVFVGSAGGVVHALRADTGCLQWTFQADRADPLGDRRRAARRRARAAVRRPHRLVLRARRGDGRQSGRSAPRSTKPSA